MLEMFTQQDVLKILNMNGGQVYMPIIPAVRYIVSSTPFSAKSPSKTIKRKCYVNAINISEIA